VRSTADEEPALSTAQKWEKITKKLKNKIELLIRNGSVNSAWRQSLGKKWVYGGKDL